MGPETGAERRTKKFDEQEISRGVVVERYGFEGAGYTSDHDRELSRVLEGSRNAKEIPVVAHEGDAEGLRGIRRSVRRTPERIEREPFLESRFISAGDKGVPGDDSGFGVRSG